VRAARVFDDDARGEAEGGVNALERVEDAGVVGTVAEI
jgi:hypothetical protein